MKRKSKKYFYYAMLLLIAFFGGFFAFISNGLKRDVGILLFCFSLAILLLDFTPKLPSKKGKGDVTQF